MKYMYMLNIKILWLRSELYSVLKIFSKRVKEKLIRPITFLLVGLRTFSLQADFGTEGEIKIKDIRHNIHLTFYKNGA